MIQNSETRSVETELAIGTRVATMESGSMVTIGWVAYCLAAGASSIAFRRAAGSPNVCASSCCPLRKTLGVL